MRRAVIQNLRTFRRPTPRKVLKQLRITNQYNLAFQRSIASRNPQPLRSSMQITRRISIPVALGLAAGASYYAYQQQGATRTAPPSSIVTSSLTAGQGKGYATVASTEATPVNPGLHVLDDSEVPEAVRKALIVDQGQLYTAQIPADQHITKETDYSGRRVLEMLTAEQASAKLRTNEESYLVGRGEGVVRYDVVQIPSNEPIEDDHIEKIVEVPNTIAATENGKNRSDWMFWGVFDGHSGWTTSAKLRQTLVSYVARELNATYRSALQDPQRTFPSADAVDAAIKKGFLTLDNEIVYDSVQKVLKAQSRVVAAEILAPALSGSCALLSFYDGRSKELRVACTGDSRAVLGRRGASGMWTATALSIDQTGGTPSEQERLQREHPGEPNVTSNGRILGSLEPSRAFGDAVYKWSQKTQDKIKKTYFGRSPSKYLKTPPYVTAEPVITTTKVEPAKGDFVVMATDGLWEMLTNEEVVGLVGQWLEKQESGSLATSSSSGGGPSSRAPSWLQGWFGTPKVELPIEHHAQADGSGQRAPIRQEQWGVPAGEDQRFVVEDKNVATHLVRNALGGRDRDMLSALLTLPAPYSRRYRDDLTVQVIFFGDAPGNGKIELNVEASATAAHGAAAHGVDGIKAKL